MDNRDGNRCWHTRTRTEDSLSDGENFTQAARVSSAPVMSSFSRVGLEERSASPLLRYSPSSSTRARGCSNVGLQHHTWSPDLICCYNGNPPGESFYFFFPVRCCSDARFRGARRRLHVFFRAFVFCFDRGRVTVSHTSASEEWLDCTRARRSHKEKEK